MYEEKKCSLYVSLSTHYYLIKINGGPLGNYKFIIYNLGNGFGAVTA